MRPLTQRLTTWWIGGALGLAVTAGGITVMATSAGDSRAFGSGLLLLLVGLLGVDIAGGMMASIRADRVEERWRADGRPSRDYAVDLARELRRAIVWRRWSAVALVVAVPLTIYSVVAGNEYPAGWLLAAQAAFGLRSTADSIKRLRSQLADAGDAAAEATLAQRVRDPVDDLEQDRPGRRDVEADMPLADLTERRAAVHAYLRLGEQQL